MALVLCSDKNLHWQSTFALLRHARHDPGRMVDLFYYTTDEVPETLQGLLKPRVTICHWTESIHDSGYGRPDYITKAALLRIFALNDLTARYDLVAYTDSDVFPRWGSFSDLGRVDLGDAPLAAVRDRSLWGAEPEQWVSRHYFPQLPVNTQGRYFNSGVLVANSSAWQSRGTGAEALDFLTRHPEKCHYGDQSALNAAVNGHWAELSPSWNWQANMRYDHLIPTRNPRLVHFTGPIKPWKDKLRRFDEYYFQSMRDFLLESGLECGFVLSDCMFDASKERLRTRMLSRRCGADLMAFRESAKPYIDRTDFIDITQGVTGYGWRGQ